MERSGHNRVQFWEKHTNYLITIILTFVSLLYLTNSTVFAVQTDMEEALKEKYIEILENGVDVFEPLYTEALTSVPDGGFFDFRKYKNWTHPRNEQYHTLCMIPGNGQVILTYAVLLKYTNKKYFCSGKYSREILFEHLRKTIRWVCITSAYVPQPYPFLPEIRDDMAKGEQWYRKWGLRQDLLGYFSVGVSLLLKDLDMETRSLFEQVISGTALRGRVPRSATSVGNGNHDQVKQDLSSTVAAAYLLTQHPEHKKFWEFLEGAGIDMVSTPKDFSSEKFIGKKKLKNLAQSSNLNSDYSSYHHNHPSLWYGVDLIFEGRAYVEILANLTGQKIPDTYTYDGNGFDGVYKYASVLATKDGVLNPLRSPEYDSSYGAGLLSFCYGAVIKKDTDAMLLEKKAADILGRHTKAIGQYDYHRGSWSKVAMAFLLHQLHPISFKKAPVEEPFKHLYGSHHFKTLRALIYRNFESWVGFVWGADGDVGSGGVGAYVMPAKAGGPFIYNSSDSLAGGVLKHRPLWLYIVFIFCSLFFFTVSLIFFKRKNEFSKVLILIAFLCIFDAVLIGWIDLFHTLPLRIPNAVVPRWSVAVVSILITLVAILAVLNQSKILSDFSHAKYFGLKPFMTALLGIPLTLLLMTRTPWIEILNTANFSESLWIHIAGILLCFFAVNFKDRLFFFKEIKLSILCVYLLVLIVVLILLMKHSTINPFYLRLVSIRNISRIYFASIVGTCFLGTGLILNFVLSKKYMYVALQISMVFFSSSFAIAMLSYGRFDLPRVNQVSQKLSDDGFSTAGLTSTSVVNRRQAFFCFDNGPTVLFLNIGGKTNGLVTWSGLPVSFYQRDNFVDSRSVHFKNGYGKIYLLEKTMGDWWCIDGLLGMVISGGEKEISGSRRLGRNWARTETYLDKIDIVSVSALRRKKLYKDKLLINMTATIYQ